MLRQWTSCRMAQQYVTSVCVEISARINSVQLYLQTAFYALSPTTAVSALLIDVLSAALPFYLLRPVSYSHRFVFSTEFFDPTVLLYTTALSSAIYAVTLVLSLTKI